MELYGRMPFKWATLVLQRYRLRAGAVSKILVKLYKRLRGVLQDQKRCDPVRAERLLPKSLYTALCMYVPWG